MSIDDEFGFVVRRINSDWRTFTVAIQAFVENGRLVQLYPTGEENDQCCIHGIKLRWSCDDCEEMTAQLNPPTKERR